MNLVFLSLLESRYYEKARLTVAVEISLVWMGVSHLQQDLRFQQVASK
jgi:hypothetical protein